MKISAVFIILERERKKERKCRKVAVVSCRSGLKNRAEEERKKREEEAKRLQRRQHNNSLFSWTTWALTPPLPLPFFSTISFQLPS